ncbi:hypothetical protein FB45DRAFT_736145 [Roridomyces roridus]|uniref:RGS domain-containing protein n=1 Tax=Roridomyces roridus TaxID=1738132 RepID=A0AAD7CAY4_9AGAR|nr:hypothetical protein FB45DRAFT_736145 [Roridomyces roridus]
MDARPKVVELSFKSILSLPIRLCKPPPAVPKARSCGVTPALKVRLDDVLDRKHLPPLGLKDFEEWLLYCEDSVENLYFILWLKEYTLKYKHWLRTASAIGDYRMDWPPTSSAQLAMFYARGKSTFCSPNAPYELNLPSATFEPLHSASTNSSHPDPLIFTQIAVETRKMLDESLSRFVTAQCSNVGNKRALCGIIAGTTFSLIGALIPLAYNLATGHSRWLRLSAFPGLWLGLTILLASFNGICVGVWVFGDLRQLRKFELSRPVISKPISRRPTISYSITAPPAVPPRLTIIPPSPAHIRSPSSSSSHSGSHSSCSISPAYYDADPVDGPATSPATPDTLATFTYPTKSTFNETGESGADPFVATASFIHPFDLLPEDDDQFGGPPAILPEERQLLSPFDFDALPRCSRPHIPRSMVKGEQQLPPKSSLRGLLERMQARCVPKWTTAVPTAVRDEKVPHELAAEHIDKESAVRKQFKMVQAVPAFAVPLTPVLSDVVVRGQWEIIVRSAVFALILSCVLLGCLLIPPMRR